MSQAARREITVQESAKQQKGGLQQQTIETEPLLLQVTKVDQKFPDLGPESATADQIMESIEAIREEIKRFEQLVDKKISKYYSELRPQPLDSQKTLQGLVEVLEKERREREKLIVFQQLEIKKIQQQEKEFDSKDNIEFAIPIEISQTKKAILQLEKFIHIAKIREKKKSEDLVKVERTNLEQFERTAMLRTNLEHAMLYEISLNEREMGIDEHMYDFQTKIDKLNMRLEQLGKIVEEKQILVSSNKGLIIRKEKKIKLLKCKEEQAKRIGILQSNCNKNINSLRKEIDDLREQISDKVSKAQELEQEISRIIAGDKKYVSNTAICKLLKKNIAFSYAETLLRVKKEEKLSSTPLVLERIGISTQKPNFKIKKLGKVGECQSLEKIAADKKKSTRYEDLLIPSSHLKNPEEGSSPKKPAYRKNASMVMSTHNIEKGQNQSEIISQY